MDSLYDENEEEYECCDDCDISFPPYELRLLGYSNLCEECYMKAIMESEG